MSRRRNRNVRPEDLQTTDAPPLETPEDDLEPIEERAAPRGGVLVIPEGGASMVIHGGERVIPQELYGRIQAARALQPAERHWMSAWEAGRDAAVEAATAGTLAAFKAQPPPDTVGCRDCWMKGRDAALIVLESD
jgi:hypothetical protein